MHASVAHAAVDPRWRWSPLQRGAHQGIHLKADWRSGSTEFRRGWLASSVPITHEIAAAWHHLTLGDLHLAVHPALGYASQSRKNHGVAFLGDVLDPERGIGDARNITRNALRVLRKDGIASAVRHVAYLGGRFTCLLRDHATIAVVPDCIGGLPSYWHADATKLVVGSYLQQVAEASAAVVDEDATAMWREISAARRTAELFWPGADTPYAGVRPVIPNHHLVWAPGTPAEHNRFYPYAELELDPDPERCYDKFVDLFTTQTRLLADLGRIGISLTGGVDSRASFAAALPHMTEHTLTWTYLHLAKQQEGPLRDLASASNLAQRHSVQHMAVDLGVPIDEDFMHAYHRTMGLTKQWPGLSNAYNHHLPRDVVEFQSMVAEVGTGFYKRRTEDPPDAERLAKLYASGDRHGRLDAVRNSMERFIDYADFRPEKLAPLDYHDLLYWEVRMGRWGTLRMQECDITHRLVLPYNARGIVEALQTPPFAARVSKPMLRRFAEERLAASRA